MIPTNAFDWDSAALAAALMIPPDRVEQFFRDGRRFAWLLEEALASRYGFERMGETQDYDLRDSCGRKWEVRCCTKGGLFFCPSNMIGKGRKFDLTAFQKKQALVAGWIVADITKFPRVPYWIIPANVVAYWWDNQLLGPTTQIGHDRFWSLIRATTFTPVNLTANFPPSEPIIS